MFITFLYFSNNEYKNNFDISHDSLLVIDFNFCSTRPIGFAKMTLSSMDCASILAMYRRISTDTKNFANYFARLDASTIP